MQPAAQRATTSHTEDGHDAGHEPRAADLRPLIVWGVILIAVFLVGARSTGPDGVSVWWEALATWGRHAPIALLWLAMAAGFGTWIEGFVLAETPRRDAERWALSLAFGVAAATALDAALGSLGVLLLGRGLGAWIVTGIGLVLLVARIRRGDAPRASLGLSAATPAIAAPLAILALAAASAPGWLWRSEFGGYDALSYHLELPKEWLLGGAVATLPHNVYSAFPSFLESAFLHVFVLSGGHEGGALAAQCLVVFLTLAAALTVGCLARRVAGDGGTESVSPVGWIAAGLYLATPWVVVVGSLAYNDGVVAFLLAAALLIAFLPAAPSQRPWRLGLGLGVLLAGACGAKLTAAGFVVVPLAAAILVDGPGCLERRVLRSPAFLGALAAAFLLPLASWLARNALATGNPVFPFLAPMFGSGPWTAEQVEIFTRAHASPFGFGEALARLWSQWIAFGVGQSPTPGEPWIIQWSVLPALGLAGVGALLLHRRSTGRMMLAVLLVQLGFWLAATHVQSRFLLPTAVPLAACAAALLARLPGARGAMVAAVATIAASFGPALVYFGEGIIRLPDPSGGSINAPALFIGASGAATGDLTRQAIQAATNDADRSRLASTAPLAFTMNHLLLPDDRILLVGHATPFWYRRGSDTMTYTTVWDRGPLDAVAEAAPDHPETWAQRLRERGYRYVLFDWTLLRNWSDKHWLNPMLTRDRVTAFANTMPSRRRGADGVEIREILPGDPPPPQTQTQPHLQPGAGVAVPSLPPAGAAPAR